MDPQVHLSHSPGPLWAPALELAQGQTGQSRIRSDRHATQLLILPGQPEEEAGRLSSGHSGPSCWVSGLTSVWEVQEPVTPPPPPPPQGGSHTRTRRGWLRLTGSC